MAKLHSTPSNQRFTWLKPPVTSAAVGGPWILSEYKQLHSERMPTQWVSISAEALLNLLASGLFAKQSQSATIDSERHDSTQSACEKFEIRRLKKTGDNTRLFVQQRADYFQRLELYVENELIAAFNEPVWPHLQHPNTGSRLNVPLACTEFLESLATRQPENDMLCDSANQADINTHDSTAVA